MNRFAIIPYELYDDLANGEITLSMFQALILLHKWADWGTGVVRKVRASRMEQASGEHGPAARTFQRALKNLHDSGRITSYHVAGSRSWYKIAINNFTALSGALKDTVSDRSRIYWDRSHSEYPLWRLRGSCRFACVIGYPSCAKY
jgi:hypothetical protein